MFLCSSHLQSALFIDPSLSAIKSAIMTTSSAVDNDGQPIKNEEHREAIYYAVGAGLVVPASAVDPGLVYDLRVRDYAGYICALIGEDALKAIAGTTSLTCAHVAHVAEAQLNYPAILVPLQSELFTVQRTVTNVGPENSHYTARIRAPEGLTITVEPTELEFTEVKETKTFTVSVSGGNGMKKKPVEGVAASRRAEPHHNRRQHRRLIFHNRSHLQPTLLVRYNNAPGYIVASVTKLGMASSSHLYKKCSASHTLSASGSIHPTI
jgi:hypothetical protein